MKTFPRLSLLTTLMAAATFSGGAFAATATGTANATVIAPIAITNLTALNFGTFAANAAGTITLSTANVRTATASAFVFPTSNANATTVGSFRVTGAGGYTFSVSLPASFTVTTGAATMSGTVLLANGTATGTGTLPGTVGQAAQTLDILVGGTLTAAAAQAAGSYTGSYVMTVEYN